MERGTGLPIEQKSEFQVEVCIMGGYSAAVNVCQRATGRTRHNNNKDSGVC